MTVATMEILKRASKPPTTTRIITISRSSKYTSNQQRIYFTTSEKYQFACDHHITEACRALAYQHAPQYYKAACTYGDAGSCRDAAPSASTAVEAIRDHERACTLSNSASASCVDVAVALATGHGAPRDTVRARSMLVQRCHDGSQDACGAFGELVSEGILAAQVTP